jgi:hypothetical protein
MPTIMSHTEERDTPVEVARAVAAVGRAIGRLVGLLGDEDPLVVHGAAAALAALGGPAVVGPLASALPRAPTPRHRALILATLTPLARGFEDVVVRALVEAVKREDDAFVALEMRRAITTVIAARLCPPGPPNRTLPGTAVADT